MTFRRLNSTAPSCLADSICRVADVEGRHHLRSSATATLIVPPVRRSTLGDRSFSVAAPRAWNSLPSAVWAASSLTTSRWELKHFFFTRVFRITSYQFTVSSYVICRYLIDCVKCPCSVLRDSVTYISTFLIIIIIIITCTQCIRCSLLLQLLPVAWSVCLSVSVCVCRSQIYCAKKLLIPFRRQTLVRAKNHVLDGVEILPWAGAILWGFPAHWKAFGVSSVVHTAKGIIHSSIMAWQWDAAALCHITLSLVKKSAPSPSAMRLCCY